MTQSLKQSQNVRLDEQIKADAFAIFLERTTVKKEEKDYAKKRNNGLPGHNANINTIGKLPYNDVVRLSATFIRRSEKQLFRKFAKQKSNITLLLLKFAWKIHD